jgi:hypothetical protein
MKAVVSIFFVLMLQNSYAQYTNVLISTQYDPEEVSICINPKNPNQVVAGSNTDNVYYSTDGGLTWTDTTLYESVTGVWGDPIIFTDTAGVFYYSHLSNPPAGSWIDRIVFQKSTDGGATWSGGTWAGLNGTKAQDKEGIVVNQANNEIYVTWTQFDVYGSTLSTDSSIILFSRSADGGITWSAPTRISKHGGDCIDSDNTVEGAVPAVGPAGEIYVTWIGQNGFMFNKSLDGGATWLPVEQNILSVPGGWDYNIAGLQRCNGLPAMVCDLSDGPNNGTLYINWTDQRNGTTDTDVWFIKSTDGGNSWTSPLRVNDDAPGKQQFLTWMTIDQTTGYLYCVFYDRRNFPTGNQTDVYLARSIDGGNTFTNYQINSSPFTPSPSVFFGDYTSISVVNNNVRPMWMEYGSGTLSVWTAIIDGTTLGMNENPDNPYKPLANLQNNPNPFSESTVITFELENPSVISLNIYNSSGKKVATLYENEKFKKGKFNYVLNSSMISLNQGVYYYTLWTNGVPVSKRMVVR